MGEHQKANNVQLELGKLTAQVGFLQQDLGEFKKEIKESLKPKWGVYTAIISVAVAISSLTSAAIATYVNLSLRPVEAKAVAAMEKASETEKKMVRDHEFLMEHIFASKPVSAPKLQP